jgi:hypothetical protein
LTPPPRKTGIDGMDRGMLAIPPKVGAGLGKAADPLKEFLEKVCITQGNLLMIKMQLWQLMKVKK